MNRGSPFQYKSDSRPDLDKARHFLSGPFVPTSNEVSLPPATMLRDRFEVKRHIGHGRNTVIYLAEDLIEKTEVVLKIVDAGPLSEEWKTSRLHQEIRISRMISEFEHIIRLFDIHTAPFGGTTLLILSMEYADGRSLRDWLDENQGDPQFRRSVGLTYFLQVCHGLSHIHDLGIIHMDVKPENMLFVNGVLKISDLGTAITERRFEKAKQPGEGIHPSDCGTLRYMSPEQFTSDPANLTSRSDIYSLGIILYELVHPKCRPPFEGSPARLRELHANAPPPPVPDVPENLAHVIERCLDKDPDNRYQSVKEIIMQLEHNDGASKVESSEELEEVWNKAQESFSRGDLNEASTYLEKMLSLDPDHETARELRNKIKERFDQAELSYRMITEDLEGNELDTLTDRLEEAIAIYPEHPSGILPQKRIEKRAKNLREALEKAGTSMNKGLWEQALHWIERATQLDPHNVQLGPTIEVLAHIKSIRSDINQALILNDFDNAMHLARFADAIVDEMKKSIPVLRDE